MRRAFLAGAAAALLAAAPARAQQPTQPPPADTARVAPDTTARPAAPVPPDSVTPDTLRRIRISPGSAFLRSVLVPGWGQISAGAYKRAAVFIALQGASDFMLVKTLRKLSDARKQWDARFAFITDSIRSAAPDSSILRTDPVALRDTAYAVADTTNNGQFTLIKSRKKQREDWITLSVFWTLISGLDAFINAQLQDFPVDVHVEPQAGGGMLFRAAVPVRRFW